MKSGADLVLFNGKFITVDRSFSIQEAVAIRSGRIIFVGSLSDLKKKYPIAEKEVDLKKLTVIPGIIDSHIHMMAIGLERMKVSLEGTESITDVLDIIARECRIAGPGVWVVTNQIGFAPGQLREKRLPDRWEIDRVSPKNPVMIARGAHFSVVNSMALKMAGIDRETVPDEGGIIMKDKDTGEPTGWLGDATLQRIRRLLPPVSHEDRVHALTKAMYELNELGITAIIEASGDRDDPGLRAYRELWKNGALTVRTRMVVGAPFQPVPLDDIEMGPIETARKRGLGDNGDDMLRLWGVKLMIDGGVETAFMREPYKIIPKEQEDPAYRGLLMMPKEKLKEICLMAASKGWRLGIHVVGDAAMDVVLEAFDSANRRFNIKEKRWSIMHGFLPRPEHFEIMRKLGITVACQHSHSYTKGDIMVKWWGRERAAYSNPVKTYIRERIVAGGGSDGKSCEWRTNILFWTDVTRETRLAGVLGPDLTLTREEMLRYHTIDAAYVMGEEENVGSIEPGKWADLTVLSKDILRCSTEELKGVQAVMTVVNGKIAYNRRSE